LTTSSCNLIVEGSNQQRVPHGAEIPPRPHLSALIGLPSCAEIASVID